MNILKIAMLAFAVVGCWACNDDDGDMKTTGGVVPEASKVAVSFQDAGKTVLKNSGVVNIPVVLAEAAPEQVKVAISVKQASGDTIAKEDVDFTISSKVLVVEKGSKIANVEVVLNNDGKTDAKAKIFELQISGVYGAGKKAAEKQACLVAVVSNAFIEFQYAARETKESAGTYKVPLLIMGEIREATTVTVRVKEGGTALEGTHFSIKNLSVVLEKGATSGEIEVELVDDSDANADRWFDLEIVAINGSNAVIGKGMPCCKLTIVSEEVLKAVSFAVAVDTVVEGQELRIPIKLSKAPVAGEPNVVITLDVKNSTGVEGTDFTVENKTVTFVAGQKEDEVVIKTNENHAMKDFVFDLTIKAAVGANLDTIDACKVTIANKDFPAFGRQVYKVAEDTGAYRIPVTLPYTYTENTVLKLEIVPASGTVENTHFTIVKEVTVPAGSQSGEVSMEIKYGEIWNDPSFKIIVKEANGITLGQEVATTVAMTPCAYRKLLGNWTMNAFAPDNCKGASDAVISMVTWQKEVHVIMKSFWNAKDCYFNMTFDKETQKLKIILNKRMQDDNWNFGAPNTDVGLRFLVDGQIDLVDIEMNSYDVEKGIITFPKDKHMGGGGSNGNLTGAPTAWGFFFKNGNLTKK